MAFAVAGFCVTWLPRLLSFTRLSLLILTGLTLLVFSRFAGLAFPWFAWLLPRFARLTLTRLTLTRLTFARFTFPRLTPFTGFSGFARLTGLIIRRLLGGCLFCRLSCGLFRCGPLSRFLVNHF